MKNKKDIMLISGNANIVLAEEISAILNIPLVEREVKTFSDGETYVEIKDNVRGRDVFVIQPTCTPVNDHLMELMLIADALRRASARRITAVMPYYGYARQDRKVAPRVPISAKVVAEMLMVVGFRRVLTMDLHAGQIQGFFSIPVDNMYCAPVILDDIRTCFGNGDDVVMVSPDAGGVERTRAFAKRLDADLAIIDKRRERANVAEAMNVIGDVEGKKAILLDDMVDTAGTLCGAATMLLKAGAKEVHAYCSHAVLSGPAIDRITNSDITTLVVTNTIPLRENAKNCPKIKVLSVSNLLAQAISCIHSEDSVSSLFV